MALAELTPFRKIERLHGSGSVERIGVNARSDDIGQRAATDVIKGR